MEQSNGLIIISYLTITNQKSNSVCSDTTVLPARNVYLIEIFGLAFAVATGLVPRVRQGGLASPINMLGFSIQHTCSFDDIGFSA